MEVEQFIFKEVRLEGPEWDGRGETHTCDYTQGQGEVVEKYQRCHTLSTVLVKATIFTIFF